ncbi:MAG: ABC transporter permease [Labedaea sp.]
MLKFAVRRFGQAVLVIVAATFFLYIGVFQLGNPFAELNEKTLPPDTQVMLRAKFGMDKPFFLQYLIYLKNIFTGEFGIDFGQRREVSELIGAATPHTFRLALLAVLISLVIGLLAGIAAAVWRDTFVDALVTVTTVVLLCFPVLATGFLLRSLLSGWTVFPELPHPFGTEVSWLPEMLLPAITLALADLAFISRLMRASMLEVLQANYLHTARAKGLSQRRVIFKHGVRNALIPVVNHVGINLGVLMGGAVIVESIFQYPGLGYLFVRSLRSTNNPVMLAIAVLAMITFVALSAVVDVVGAYLDPRIRLN